MAHYPSNVIAALDDAIVKVFWTKRDLRALLDRAGVPPSLSTAQDWSQFKFFIVAPVVDDLNGSPDGLGPLRRLLRETLTFTNADHLLRFTDGRRLKREAEAALERLRLLVREHDDALEAERQERVHRVTTSQPPRHVQFDARLAEIRDRFLAAHASSDAQARGYDLEKILYDLFRLHDLEVRGPFRRKGEQIDGAFVHDGQHFLLEAKWQKDPVDLGALRDLDGAVSSSLDNTLGLFFSLNNFSKQALDAYVMGNRPRLVCMDGVDLMAILSGQINLIELLRRKLEVAVARRRIFVPVGQILSGAV